MIQLLELRPSGAQVTNLPMVRIQAQPRGLAGDPDGWAAGLGAELLFNEGRWARKSRTTQASGVLWSQLHHWPAGWPAPFPRACPSCLSDMCPMHVSTVGLGFVLHSPGAILMSNLPAHVDSCTCKLLWPGSEPSTPSSLPPPGTTAAPACQPPAASPLVSHPSF